MSFEKVIGHRKIINHLKNVIDGNRPSHAYVFHGEDGVGKKMVAREFAKGIMCEAGEGRPCGLCRSCKQFESGNNPDFFSVSHEKSVISVDDVRTQILDRMAIKPYSNKYKVFIVDEAEKMNEQAQNALLKTLEEPPEYGVIILITNNLFMFLDTILSRAVSLAFLPCDTAEVAKLIMTEREVPDYRAKTAAACAGGRPGMALRLIDSEEFEDKRDECIGILKRIGSGRADFAVKKSKELSAKKDDIYFFTEMFESYIRDVLYYKSAKNEKKLIFSEEISSIKRQAEELSFERIGSLIDGARLLKDRLDANVYTEASLYEFLNMLQ
ncbi:MAG: AAA family ATPase [Clostridiales bacterium]|nr:AAA family ATPase [Clostridiales bacterium]